MMLPTSEYQQCFEEAWYCARTQPKHEHIAAAGLARRLGLEVFHPRLRLEKVTRRGVVRVVEPLFPCYILVRCKLDEKIDQIRYVNGISSLVQFGQRVPSVPDHVVDELRQCFEDDEPLAIQEQLHAGSEVTVCDGAFMGASGVVVKILPAKRRVQILLDFLGRPTLAEVGRESLSVNQPSMATLMPSLATPARVSVLQA
jgi:transcriptional antiterminator RfaH